MTKKISIKSLLARNAQNWPETNNPATDTMLSLIRFKDIVMERCNKTIARHGLSEAAFEVLATLRSFPKPRQLTPTELYRSVLISSGGMTKVINQLREKGLVRYITNETDKRSKLVQITEAGENLIEIVMEDVMRQDNNLLSSVLAPEDIGRLRRILLECLDKLEED